MTATMTTTMSNAMTSSLTGSMTAQSSASDSSSSSIMSIVTSTKTCSRSSSLTGSMTSSLTGSMTSSLTGSMTGSTTATLSSSPSSTSTPSVTPTNSGSAALSQGAPPSVTPTSSYLPPAPIAVRMDLVITGMNVTTAQEVLNATQLLTSIAAGLGVPVGQLQLSLNASVDGTVTLTVTLAVPPPSLSTLDTAVLYTVQLAQYEQALLYSAVLSGWAAGFNATNVTDPLVEGMAPFVAAAASLLGLTTAEVYAYITPHAALVHAEAPVAPGGAGCAHCLSSGQIVGVVVGVLLGVVVVAIAIAMVVRHRGTARKAAAAKGASAV